MLWVQLEKNVLRMKKEFESRDLGFEEDRRDPAGGGATPGVFNYISQHL